MRQREKEALIEQVSKKFREEILSKAMEIAHLRAHIADLRKPIFDETQLDKLSDIFWFIKGYMVSAEDSPFDHAHTRAMNDTMNQLRRDLENAEKLNAPIGTAINVHTNAMPPVGKPSAKKA